MYKKKKFPFLTVICISLLISGCSRTVPAFVPTGIPKTEKPSPSVKPQKGKKGESAFLSIQKRTGSAVTDGFLQWIEKEYGKKAVEQLAAGLERKEKDIWHSVTGKSLFVLRDEYKKKEKNSEASGKNNIYYVPHEGKKPVVFTFAGDVSLDDSFPIMRYYDQNKQKIERCFSKELLKKMRSSDVFIINNEFTYSLRGTPLPNKSYTFRANPKRVAVLGQLGVDAVSLGNNHVYDYGPEALTDTLNTLKKADIPYIGAGKNLEEAQKPLYYITGGRKIAIVSATQIERSTLYTSEATKERPGVLRTTNPARFLKVIKKAKKNSDFVIVYVHWGTENTPYYGADQESLGKQYIEAGADAVIGAHPHCLQGIGFYKKKPIVYSLGNFWFSRKIEETCLAQLEMGKDGFRLSILPCIQKGCKTSLLTGDREKQKVWNDMEKVSNKVQIDRKGLCSIQ